MLRGGRGSGGAADELRGLILLDATLPKAWERVALLKFGARLGEPATHHVYLEVQGRCARLIPVCLPSWALMGCLQCVKPAKAAGIEALA